MKLIAQRESSISQDDYKGESNTSLDQHHTEENYYIAYVFETIESCCIVDNTIIILTSTNRFVYEFYKYMIDAKPIAEKWDHQRISIYHGIN